MSISVNQKERELSPIVLCVYVHLRPKELFKTKQKSRTKSTKNKRRIIVKQQSNLCFLSLKKHEPLPIR